MPPFLLYFGRMARKEAPKKPELKGGANEILGIGLLALAVLFLLALFSFDKGDLSINGTNVNDPLHNLVGTLGAWLAQGCFMALGVAAYLLPPLTLIFALAFFTDKLDGLRRRWPWAVALILAGAAGLSLYPGLFGGLAESLNTVDAGGYVGMLLHKGIFQHVGTAGATVLLLAVYLVSLLYLTNFKLKDWAKAAWEQWKLRKVDRSQPLANEEIDLNKREAELQQKVAALEQELAEAAQAVPGAATGEEPNIIDLSQPQTRQKTAEPADDADSVDEARRKLAAIVFTDIVDYSTLANQDEKAALKLLKKQRRLLKPLVKAHEGEWLKEIGDGLLLSFDSSLNAVECALAIQDKVRGEEHLELRIGIHQGDVVREGNDILGDGVNIASRIEEYAPVGGVAVSGKIQQDLASQPQYDVRLLGEFVLEGLGQKSEIYTVAIAVEELPETVFEDEELTANPEAGAIENAPVEEADHPVATAEDILGEKEDDTEPTVHIAPAISSTGPAKPAKPRKAKPTAVARGPIIENYNLPPVEYLQAPEFNAAPTDSTEELKAAAITIQQTLKQFGVEVTLGDITKGPTITRFELHPAPGVKMEKITTYSNNIAAALEAERINILAPVPGKSTVGVEVPNRVKTKVIMRDLLESDEWKKSKAKVPVALGKDVYGKPIVADLAEMPHLLIAGATGAGKSVCMNSIVASLLYKFSPDDLRLVMIDPKVVELQMYNTLPHLAMPVVTDPKKVILALRWVVSEMEKRYKIFAKENVKNIHSFNKRRRDKPPAEPEPQMSLFDGERGNSEGFAVEIDEEIVVPRDEEIEIPDRLSYIVVVIDELADLMLTAPAEVENAIARITQMARAAGIHCIVATQRPSVKVITGVIKANIPSRIAFQVASKIDSRVILDEMGAEKLLGKGDMLYQPPGAPKPIRAQGPLVTDEEVQQIVSFITEQGKPKFEVEITQQLSKPAAVAGSASSGEDEDLIQQCIEVIRSEQKASVSKLQRRLRLGYTRAARIMDELEDRGIVGPAQGNEPREILIDLDGTGADGRGQGVAEMV